MCRGSSPRYGQDGPADLGNPVSAPRTALMNSKSMAEHLEVRRYGDFELTDAIRPAPERAVLPREGFRIETYRDAKAGFQVPVLAASVSREKLFDAFLDLLDPLGDVVDVILETSHDTNGTKHVDLFREAIDLPILKSFCCDFEELLLGDGCTGLAVMSSTGPMEVQFDEHKLLVVYAADVRPFAQTLRNNEIRRNDKLKLITEGEHLHSTDPKYRAMFEQFCYRLGVGEAVERVSW
jgi:hypothetical protein